jgi:Macrocin-O-methyltransferase (TylF)
LRLAAGCMPQAIRPFIGLARASTCGSWWQRKWGTKKFLYLEFGVYQGAAIRYWSKLLKHPEARLQGFDSFEGLPEHWHAAMPKGFFDVEGKVPVVDDTRVQFFKGWFNETLPGHIFPPHNQLIVNIDCDLYSSSAYVLDELTPLIGIGTFLYFDEFCYVDHELRAFDEFRTRTKMKFSLFSASRPFLSVVFRRVS